MSGLREILPSRYARTPRYIIQDENRRAAIVGFRRTFYRYALPRTRKHLVKEGETLTDIAMHYYNIPELWHAIADANYENFYPIDLVVGSEIVIPPLDIARDNT